jgi:hypothetical protein
LIYLCCFLSLLSFVDLSFPCHVSHLFFLLTPPCLY